MKKRDLISFINSKVLVATVLTCGFIVGTSLTVIAAQDVSESSNSANITKSQTKAARPLSTLARSADMDYYVAKVRRNIKNNWYPPVDAFENEAIITLTISKDGQLLNCKLAKPSPSETFNNSLVEAAKKTVYAPLPKKVQADSVDIDFSFGMQRRHVENK